MSRKVSRRVGMLRSCQGYRTGRERRDRPDHDRHPRPARPAAVGPVALAGGDRPRHRLDPRRAGGDDRRLDVRRAEAGRSRAGDEQLPGRRGRRGVRRGRVRRGAVLRPAHRPARPQEAVHGLARRLHRRHRAHGVLDEPGVVLRRPLPDRHRHRRRVRRDQLRHRRADPGQVPRPRRRRDQRLLLDRRRRRCAATIPLLDPTVIDQAWGWRLAFGLGAILAVGILLVRRNVPESPRWLFIHGREEEAEQIVRDIERTVEDESGEELHDVTRRSRSGSGSRSASG